MAEAAASRRNVLSHVKDAIAAVHAVTTNANQLSREVSHIARRLDNLPVGQMAAEIKTLTTRVDSLSEQLAEHARVAGDKSLALSCAFDLLDTRVTLLEQREAELDADTQWDTFLGRLGWLLFGDK